MKTGRSPLKQPPLRNPGESLQKMRDDYISDELVPYLVTTGFLFILAGIEWLHHFGILPVSPNVFMVFAIWGLAISVVKFFRVRKQVRAYNRGLEAEKSVGQFLEQFRTNGYKVFHDIPGESGGKKFNLDHVLVGPKGIFTIETKGRTKPVKGECKVRYDGHHISVNGGPPSREPIDQAKAQAAWLEDLLRNSTALKSVPVAPLVVFPGWFVDYDQARGAKVKVTTEKLIWSCIQSSPFTLEPHDAALIESRLTQHIQQSK
jgi:hypothetical protein